MRSSVVAALGTVLVLAAAACGGEPDAVLTATSSGEINERVVEGCPAKFEATNGERCATDNAVCTVPITCSTFDQQATCRCTRGRFACSDSVGKIPVGIAPRCVAMDAASTEACAPTLEESHGTACETLGHSCAYPGVVCPERPVQNMDTCTCLRDATTRELAMKCRVAQCNPLYNGAL